MDLSAIFSSIHRMATVPTLSDVEFSDGSIFVYSAMRSQDRENADHWRARGSGDGRYIAVTASAGDLLTLEFGDNKKQRINVKDIKQIRDLFPPESQVVIDISGIGHDFWAGCLLALDDRVAELTYVYTEPYEYQPRSEIERVSPFELFDLSPSTRGLRALCGFANLSGPGRRRSLFVPLLGFEGQRALNVFNEIDPPAVTVPIIGVPGYSVEFPIYAAYCNRDFFVLTESRRRWRAAPANDPFALHKVLGEIHSEYQGYYMYVAPIGTRPHALGSLLYVKEHPELSEILFDHPVSHQGSRQGVGPSHLYRVLPK